MAIMERRKRIRFIERNDVAIAPVSHENNGKRTKAHTFDISTGGARIIAEDCFEVGTVLRIRVDLARTQQSMTVEGEVKWSRFNERSGLFEMGIEFLHLTSPKILALIKHLYGQNCKPPWPVA
jgi:c-di-GMP-binding flagellar brake protein YcgR